MKHFGEAADCGEVLRRALEYGLEFRARRVELVQLDEGASERHSCG